MKEELDKKLCEDFPLLYADRNASMQETCMCWGFEVGDGWHDIIYKLSDKLEKMIKEYEKKNPDAKGIMKASQVKEKFGTLRYYMTSSTDEMEKVISKAESQSAKTCEVCGKPGDLTGKGWYRTLCNKCVKK